MNLQRILCAVGGHNWLSHGRPAMGDRRRCSECGQVELAYEVWDRTYYHFDRWVREEDWYKISLGQYRVAKDKFL